jgi:FtsX-like permease family protein
LRSALGASTTIFSLVDALFYRPLPVKEPDRLVRVYSKENGRGYGDFRMALGAQPQNVLKLVIGQGMRLAVLGLAVGSIVAFAVMSVTSSLLYGVNARDPLTFVAVVLIVVGIALGACFVPARRATRVDPMVALRYE